MSFPPVGVYALLFGVVLMSMAAILIFGKLAVDAMEEYL